MTAVKIISSIYNFIRNALGNIVIFGIVVAFIGGIIERSILSSKSKKTDNKTSSEEITSGNASPVKRIALITGASSGLGSQMARDLDKRNDFDEFILIARRTDRLEALAKELKHESKCISLDLLKTEAFDTLNDTLVQYGNIDVRYLIASAGFGKIGNYQKVDKSESERMIDLNCRALTDTVQTVLPFMTAGARIILISSTSAFQPFQQINVYAATKAYVYSYGRALRMELMPRKISVTTVCPYWMKDTEFINIAEKTENSEKNTIRSYAFGVNSKKVSKRALAASYRHAAVSTPGFVCTIHRAFAKLLPKSTLQYFWEGLRR